MSTRKHENALYEGIEPTFPEGLEALNLAYDSVDTTGSDLKSIGGTIKGFEEMVRPTTTDNYYWFWALVFVQGTRKVIVAFPWSQDFSRKDDVKIDRSISFYNWGFSSDMLEILAGKLSSALLKFAKEKSQQKKKLVQ